VGKSGYLLLGAAFGAAVAFAINYFLGPTDAATYDENYRSRLDFALDEGKRVAAQRELEMRGQLQTLRLPVQGEQASSPLPPAAPPAPLPPVPPA
jgi:hypothetical protein